MNLYVVATSKTLYTQELVETGNDPFRAFYGLSARNLPQDYKYDVVMDRIIDKLASSKFFKDNQEFQKNIDQLKPIIRRYYGIYKINCRSVSYPET